MFVCVFVCLCGLVDVVPLFSRTVSSVSQRKQRANRKSKRHVQFDAVNVREFQRRHGGSYGFCTFFFFFFSRSKKKNQTDREFQKMVLFLLD